jgi:hypothetical protein
MTWYKSGQISEIKQIVRQYHVKASCDHCDLTKDIQAWFGYIDKHFPEWEDGQQLEL